jgi:predicted nucleic acid-binding protein
MIVLDTNVISEAAKPRMEPSVKLWFGDRAAGSLYATAVSLAEVVFGIEKMPEGQRKTDLGEDMQVIFEQYLGGRILPFDEAAARAYGKIVAAARRKGRSILIADGQIAAIAHVHGFSVATRDTAPFEAAGIPVINPWKL